MASRAKGRRTARRARMWSSGPPGAVLLMARTCTAVAGTSTRMGLVPGTYGTRWDNPCVPRYESILDAIGETPLVGMQRLSPNPRVRLWAKLEGNNPTGSTNTGIALAMVARRKGYRLTVVLPDNASPERIGLLRLFGAEIVFSDGAKGTNGSIEVARALTKDDKYFMPFQYGNPANPGAHERGTAQEIIRDL